MYYASVSCSRAAEDQAQLTREEPEKKIPRQIPQRYRRQRKKKSYFEERSDIETPDSIDTSVELDHIDDGVYYYTLGKDEEEAKAFVVVYMGYLETMGYTVENVSEKISGSGVAGFSIRKGGQPDGNMVFASMQDVGFVLGVSWY